MFELSPSSLSLLALGIYVAYTIVSVVADPLRDIPGPFLARFTRLWYFFEVYKGSFETTNLNLHKKYGPIVRIAPNEYSVDDVEAAKSIYRVGNGFVKAQWYWAWMPPIPERANLFADMDPQHHASQRRKFASAYTMTSLVEYESSVNECTSILAQRFSELAASGQTINFGHWLQYYAFDTISLITFGNRFGFLDKGQDENRLFDAIDHHNTYSTLVGIFPFLHRFLFPILLKTGGYGTLLNFSMKQIERRRKLLKDPTARNNDGPLDFMARFLAAHESTPEKMSNDDIFTISITNIAAGSDTTGVTLSVVLYYLLKHPATYNRLQEEIDSASADGKIDDPITFRQALCLPYLQAVLKEALRIHPATGLGLQRCVPAAGTMLSGRNFPGGTTVGVNSWVAHRNVSVYGQDADKWRPERWLEIEANGRGAEVEQYFFAFGMGSRTCLGKNISLLELNKLIPQLLRRFDLVLDDELSKQEWKTLNRWFVKPQNFKGRIISRTTEKFIGRTF
ncbi:cytochrome P450 [Hyaloscypha variabilis]